MIPDNIENYSLTHTLPIIYTGHRGTRREMNWNYLEHWRGMRG